MDSTRSAENFSVKVRAFFLGAFLVCLAVLRVHNVLVFNPYWGYDGGGHIEYIRSIASGSWPDIKTNYIAWHEPLYYFVQGFVYRLTGSLLALSLVQVVLSFAVTYLSYRLLRTFVRDAWALLAAFALFQILPPMVEASTFITNELLNYFFILLIAVVFIEKFIEREPQRRDFVTLGVIGGLALLTKITAIIPLAIAVAFVAVRYWKRREKPVFAGLLLMLAITAAIDLPWQIHRARTVLPFASINNTEFLKPVPLALDDRIGFFARLDFDVFRFPAWPSGGRSFWSMLYADTFYDYYGALENRYMLQDAPRDEWVRTSASGARMSLRSFLLAERLVWFALPVVGAMILGWLIAAREFFRKRELDARAYVWLLASALLAALIYFSYRYPYYESGIVKSIFIGPAFLMLLGFGSEPAHAWLKRYGAVPLGVSLFVAYGVLLYSAIFVAA